jgi:hypothetical protein
MVAKQHGEQLSAIEAARWQLGCVPIPWHELEQAAVEVSKANPGAKGAELVNLIVGAAMEQWCTGMGCC